MLRPPQETQRAPRTAQELELDPDCKPTGWPAVTHGCWQNTPGPWGRGKSSSFLAAAAAAAGGSASRTAHWTQVPAGPRGHLVTSAPAGGCVAREEPRAGGGHTACRCGGKHACPLLPRRCCILPNWKVVVIRISMKIVILVYRLLFFY